MEIERKFLIRQMPADLEAYPHHRIEQAYLNETPVLRVRKKDDAYFFTYKSGGMLAHEEVESTINEETYRHLLAKADGRIIEKTRYCIPYGAYTIELDVFGGAMAPLVMAEVEFPTVEEANAFVPPDWFAQDVTEDPRYHNVHMALHA